MSLIAEPKVGSSSCHSDYVASLRAVALVTGIVSPWGQNGLHTARMNGSRVIRARHVPCGSRLPQQQLKFIPPDSRQNPLICVGHCIGPSELTPGDGDCVLQCQWHEQDVAEDLGNAPFGSVDGD